jgi:RimJ/RimL family protein N-acetyltransferase
MCDFDLMCAIELNPENLNYTALEMPDVNAIRAFLSYGQDLLLNGQVRYTILWKNYGVGFIDLTDYSPEKQTADIGIYVLPQYRRNQMALKALNQISLIAWGIRVYTLKALIKKENIQSCNLFEKAGYKKVKLTNDHCLYELKLSF